jgi:subtilisin family serine protease
MRKAVVLVALLGALVPSGARATVTPQVVVALIDVGINPYSDAFRDPSPVAMQPPSTYLPNYPPDCPSPLPGDWEPTTTCAIALPITFGLPVAQAYAADRTRWDAVVRGQLYYIPGTRIVGALSFGGGISRCPMEFGPVVIPGPPPPLTATGASCRERKILDDAGHGTMVASRAAGAPNSLVGSGARIVMIEGLGSASSEWAADQPWIDVQSNSWASLLPPAVDTTDETFTEIAQQQLVFVASGNGLAATDLAGELRLTAAWLDLPAITAPPNWSRRLRL